MSASALLDAIKSGKQKYAGASGKTVKIKEGRTRVRILKTAQTVKFWADCGVHWIKMGKNDKPVAVVGCQDLVYEAPCAICTAIDRAAKATTDDVALAVIKEWKARKSVLVNALVREGPNASESQPVVLELTPTTFTQVLSIAEEYLGSDVDPFDFDAGMDLIITRTGSGMDSEYTVTTTPVSKPVSKEARGKLIDLDAFIKSNFFRGEEGKALRAIASFMGMPALAEIGGPGAGHGALTSAGRTTPALAGPVSTVADAEVIDADDLAAIEELEVAKPTPAPVAAAKPAAAKPAAAPAPKTVAAPPMQTDLAGDVDSVLAELDSI